MPEGDLLIVWFIYRASLNRVNIPLIGPPFDSNLALKGTFFKYFPSTPRGSCPRLWCSSTGAEPSGRVRSIAL